MTTPIPEDDVDLQIRMQAVVARPEGWRGRSSNLIAVGLVGFIALGVVLGTAFDQGNPTNDPAVAAVSPASIASPTGRPAPTRSALATRLPAVEILGTQLPTERRLVGAGRHGVVDLSTGEYSGFPGMFDGYVTDVGEDGYACLCVRRDFGSPSGSPASAWFRRMNSAGEITFEREVLRFDGVEGVEEMGEGWGFVGTVSADRRWLAMLVTLRKPPVWSIEVHVVDIETGDVVSSTVVDRLPVAREDPDPDPSVGVEGSEPPSVRPAGTPPDGFEAWPIAIAASPGGKSLFGAVAYAEIRDGTWTSKYEAWMLPLEDGTAGDPVPVSSAVLPDPDGWCLRDPMFVDEELLVLVCVDPPVRSLGRNFEVIRVNPAGESIGNLSIPESRQPDSFPARLVIDRERRALLMWDHVQHVLTRVDVDNGDVDVAAVSETMVPADRRLQANGWAGAVDPAVVVSPDGATLYALGVGRGPSQIGTSTGVWVFDTGTLGLIDHWEPRALLNSVAVSRNGRFVYAAGASGFDRGGNENSRWPSSITVYDAGSGEIQVIYGDVTEESWLAFPPEP